MRARRLRICPESYDTLNPCHCMSFFLWVYLFIFVLQTSPEGVIDGHPRLESDLLFVYGPPRFVTTDFVIFVVYPDQRPWRWRNVPEGHGNGCRNVKPSSFGPCHQGQVFLRSITDDPPYVFLFSLALSMATGGAQMASVLKPQSTHQE